MRIHPLKKESEMSDSNYPSILPSTPPPPAAPPPPTPPSSERTWPPFLGMLSMATLIFPFLFFCIYCLYVYWLVSQSGFEAENISNADLTKFGMGTIALVCGIFIMSIVGIVIGLGALFGKTANKILGGIGLAMNAFVVIVLMCGFILFML
jgi:hypothetical protein